jgi:hypothetical protein
VEIEKILGEMKWHETFLEKKYLVKAVGGSGRIFSLSLGVLGDRQPETTGGNKQQKLKPEFAVTEIDKEITVHKHTCHPTPEGK